jgi:hypothetical protein
VNPVSHSEAAACTTREQWARLFIARNLDAHAFDVIGAYNQTTLGEHLGYFGIAEIERLQAELGAAGMTEERLAARDSAVRARRAAREERIARYLALGEAELCALPDTELVRAVALRLPDWEKSSLVSPARRIVTLAFRVDADVRNGGFDQLFMNARGDELHDAPAVFAAIGAERAARIVARAISLVSTRYPPGMRASGKSARDPAFDPLDAEYYAALPRKDERERFEARLAQYVRAHIKEL